MVCVTVHVNCTYSILFSMYLYRMSFKNCLLKYFFPNFMGMLCNKDADVEKLCVSLLCKYLPRHRMRKKTLSMGCVKTESHRSKSFISDLWVQ